MILNLKKTIIGFLERKIIGHIVLKDGIAIDFEKLDRISKLPFPITKKAFRCFWGWWVIIEGSYTC